MATSHLRVYYGPDDEPGVALRPARHAREMVTVPLGEILPLLTDAAQRRRTWLHDFERDEVTISSDLYEVILAYRNLRRPSA